jgi:hypothetical protein
VQLGTGRSRFTYVTLAGLAALFRRLKAFRRLFSRFEKLDAIFIGVIPFVLIVEALREGLRLC